MNRSFIIGALAGFAIGWVLFRGLGAGFGAGVAVGVDR